MLENLVIAIPSYKRDFEQLTLDYLERLEFPKSMIYMSVQTEDDYNAYRAKGIEERVGKLVYRPGNCVGDNRNTLLDAIPEGHYVVMMDDDVKAITVLHGDKLKPIETLGGLMQIIIKGFSEAAREFTVVFGLYPTDNAYYMSNTISDKCIVDGMFMGLVNTKARFNPQYKTKEDFEFCCRVIREYGKCVRLNSAAARAKSKSKGGCEEFWADGIGRVEAAKMLCAQYPELVAMNTRRTTGEVLMRWGVSKKR
jgi:hypothetical protein